MVIVVIDRMYSTLTVHSFQPLAMRNNFAEEILRFAQDDNIEILRPGEGAIASGNTPRLWTSSGTQDDALTATRAAETNGIPRCAQDDALARARVARAVANASLQPNLQLVELTIHPIGDFDQLLVPAALDNAALVQDQNQIRAADR